MRQGEWRKRSEEGRRRREIRRKAEGELACLHASNLLMVEGKQTMSYYLSKT